jgi:thiamine-phosphate pyrophosphorylase
MPSLHPASALRGPPPKGLYLITPDEPDTVRLIARVEAVVDQATWLQYRNKAANAALKREQLAALVPLCRQFKLPLIVNDDATLAAEFQTDGVHLGEDDGDLRAARRLLGPQAIIGVSCYDDFARGRSAAEEGADYLAFGAFFPSSTKPNARRAAFELLLHSAGFGVPRVAIGGITPDNARTVISAGADLIAVISGVFDAPDPPAAARAYRACFDA